MSSNKNVQGIVNSGSFYGFNSTNTVVSGDNNNIGISATSNRAEASNPTSMETTLQQKVKRKLKVLKEAGESNPQRELCRKKLTTFYNETTTPDILALKLQEVGVLEDNDVKKVKSEKLDFDKNDIIYDLVFRKGEILKLLSALDKSGNKHILKLIDELAN